MVKSLRRLSQADFCCQEFLIKNNKLAIKLSALAISNIYNAYKLQ